MYNVILLTTNPHDTSNRLANHLIARGTLSIRAQRKLFNTLGALGVATGFVCLALLRCTSPYVAMVVLALVLGCNSIGC